VLRDKKMTIIIDENRKFQVMNCIVFALLVIITDIAENV
jgi:hypothetical protein